MDFLVVPPEPTAWRLDAAAVAAAIRRRWPRAVLHDGAQDPAYALHAVLPGGVELRLGRDGQTLGIDGELAKAAAVAAWFRGLVDPGQPLLFADPALNGAVALVRDAAALVRAYADDVR